MTAIFTKTVTGADIVLFAGITGDITPYLDEGAKPTRKGRIAHGMLTVGFISAVLGTQAARTRHLSGRPEIQGAVDRDTVRPARRSLPLTGRRGAAPWRPRPMSATLVVEGEARSWCPSPAA
jgi:3-hydroxybutyryl-CoA dehydratase